MTFQESDDKPQGLPDYRYLKLDLFFWWWTFEDFLYIWSCVFFYFCRCNYVTLNTRIYTICYFDQRILPIRKLTKEYKRLKRKWLLETTKRGWRKHFFHSFGQFDILDFLTFSLFLHLLGALSHIPHISAEKGSSLCLFPIFLSPSRPTRCPYTLTAVLCVWHCFLIAETCLYWKWLWVQWSHCIGKSSRPCLSAVCTALLSTMRERFMFWGAAVRPACPWTALRSWMWRAKRGARFHHCPLQGQEPQLWCWGVRWWCLGVWISNRPLWPLWRCTTPMKANGSQRRVWASRPWASPR